MEDVLKELMTLEADELVGWLLGFLNGTRLLPEPLAGLVEAHHQLFAIYQGLEGIARERFEEAIVAALESTVPVQENAKVLYSLFHLTAIVKGPKVKRLLRRFLFAGALRGLTHGGQELLVMATNLCGKYDVDDELASYLWSEARIRTDLPFAFSAFRLLSIKSGTEAANFFKVLLPLVREPPDKLGLVRQVGDVVGRLGFSFLYYWYQDLLEKPSTLREQDHSTIVEVLLEHIKKDAVKQSLEPFSALLAAELYAGKVDFDGETLLLLASFRDEVDESRLRRTIWRVWELTRELRGKTSPWRVEYGEHSGQVFRERPTPAICVGGVCELAPNRLADLNFLNRISVAAELNRTRWDS